MIYLDYFLQLEMNLLLVLAALRFAPGSYEIARADDFVYIPEAISIFCIGKICAFRKSPTSLCPWCVISCLQINHGIVLAQCMFYDNFKPST